MRLIDADALCAHIENEFYGVCIYDVSGNEAAREFCDMVDIAPTIPAIPVEWLKAQIRSYTGDVSDIGKSARNGTIKDLIRKWQKEQEAR